MLSRALSFAALAACTVLAVSAAGAAESVQFNYRLPQVGDQVSSAARYDFDVNVTIEKSDKTASTKTQKKSRSVSRQIEVLAVTGDRAAKVKVTYGIANTGAPEPPSPNGSSGGELQTPLPIEDKTYLVERRGFSFPLVITDAAGNPVPEDERALVAGNMESVGRRNQLGRFLHGKTVSVGDTLQLPKEMAAELLGMREANGDAQRLELKLTKIASDPRQPIANFAATLAVKMGSTSTINLTGPLQIDVNTARILAADFSGSINSRDGQADHGEVVDVLTDGTLKIAVTSKSLK